MTSDNNNTRFGFLALSQLVIIVNKNEGNNNTASGYKSSQTMNGGSYNTTLGSNSGDNIKEGSLNTIIGARASSASLTTGYSNTIIGAQAGTDFPVTGSYNTMIGFLARCQVDSTYSTAIGANSRVTDNHQIMMGTDLEYVHCPANVNIVGTLTVYKSPFFNITTAIPSSIKASTSTLTGLSIHWNTNEGTGQTDFLNYAQGGGGGFASHKINNSGFSQNLAIIRSDGITSSSFSPTSDYRIK